MRKYFICLVTMLILAVCIPQNVFAYEVHVNNITYSQWSAGAYYGVIGPHIKDVKWNNKYRIGVANVPYYYAIHNGDTYTCGIFDSIPDFYEYEQPSGKNYAYMRFEYEDRSCTYSSSTIWIDYFSTTFYFYNTGKLIIETQVSDTTSYQYILFQYIDVRMSTTTSEDTTNYAYWYPGNSKGSGGDIKDTLGYYKEERVMFDTLDGSPNNPWISVYANDEAGNYGYFYNEYWKSYSDTIAPKYYVSKCTDKCTPNNVQSNSQYTNGPGGYCQYDDIRGQNLHIVKQTRFFTSSTWVWSGIGANFY